MLLVLLFPTLTSESDRSGQGLLLYRHQTVMRGIGGKNNGPVLA